MSPAHLTSPIVVRQQAGWVPRGAELVRRPPWGQWVGLCWPGRGTVPWAASIFPLLGTLGRPGHLSEDVLWDKGPHVFQSLPISTPLQMDSGFGSLTFLESESYTVQCEEVRAWPLLIQQSSEGSKDLAPLRVSTQISHGTALGVTPENLRGPGPGP